MIKVNHGYIRAAFVQLATAAGAAHYRHVGPGHDAMAEAADGGCAIWDRTYDLALAFGLDDPNDMAEMMECFDIGYCQGATTARVAEASASLAPHR